MDAEALHHLSGCYWEALLEYLQDPSEESRTRGYELARLALADGYGLLELSTIHHQAVRKLFQSSPDDRNADALLASCGEFFAECLSPFEMSHRGAQEGRRALRHLNEVLESEIKRIAHALHDEAGQLLASLHITIANIAAEMPETAQSRFDEVNRLLKQIEVELRDLSHELRPTVLDNLGLVPALEVLAENVAKRNSLAVSVREDAVTRLPPLVETALYRIVQEALNNVVKHAYAHSARIELEHQPGKVACSVKDDGVGYREFRSDENQGLGLIGIRERVNALGGSLSIVAAPRRGTTLRVEIPFGD